MCKIYAFPTNSVSPSFSKHVKLCDVCHTNEAYGVFDSGLVPSSFGYCMSCGSQGAEPYGAVVGHYSLLYTVKEWKNSFLLYLDTDAVRSTLQITGKSEHQFVSDVERAISLRDLHQPAPSVSDSHIRGIQLKSITY